MSNLIQYPLRRLPTKKWGLLHEFTLYPYYDDNADYTSVCDNCHPPGTAFGEDNRQTLTQYIEPWMRSIVEIGVSRDGWEVSSTKVLFDNKHPDCHYLGIDIEDRNFVLNKSTNVRFKQNSSWDILDNIKTILENGQPWIDLLLIDGDHSVNAVLREWEYAKLVRPNGGVIVLHDTNFHPGPWCLMECVNPELFTITKSCVNYNDWGLGILRRT